MTIVVDASVIFAWQFPDEDGGRVEPIVRSIPRRGCLVPSHWHAEIANGFALAVRRNRMSAAYRDGALRSLTQLPIEVDRESSLALWSDVQRLCDASDLTAYDAGYLELALRHGLALATLDRQLARAAAARSVELLGPSPP